MPLINLTPIKWYIIFSILTLVCLANLVLAVIASALVCDEGFALQCDELDNWKSPINWIVIGIALVTFIILIYLLFHVVKIRKQWELEAQRLQKEYEMRVMSRKLMRMKKMNKSEQPNNNNDANSENNSNQNDLRS